MTVQYKTRSGATSGSPTCRRQTYRQTDMQAMLQQPHCSSCYRTLNKSVAEETKGDSSSRRRCGYSEPSLSDCPSETPSWVTGQPTAIREQVFQGSDAVCCTHQGRKSMCMCACICVYIHIYIYTKIYIYIYIYIRIYAPELIHCALHACMSVIIYSLSH